MAACVSCPLNRVMIFLFTLRIRWNDKKCGATPQLAMVALLLVVIIQPEGAHAADTCAHPAQHFVHAYTGAVVHGMTYKTSQCDCRDDAPTR